MGATQSPELRDSALVSRLWSVQIGPLSDAESRHVASLGIPVLRSARPQLDRCIQSTKAGTMPAGKAVRAWIGRSVGWRPMARVQSGSIKNVVSGTAVHPPAEGPPSLPTEPALSLRAAHIFDFGGGHVTQQPLNMTVEQRTKVSSFM